MKKNTMMRVASALLVAVLLTTCAISGTFAKYVTSGEATDIARVAKWGVKIVANGNAFGHFYDSADGQLEYVYDAATDSVASGNGQKVIAPGTNGSVVAMDITGSPEVDVHVEYTATVSLTNWGTYCPLIFTVDGATYAIPSDSGLATPDVICSDAADLAAKVSAAVSTYSADYEANTDLSTAVTPDISWEWPYSTSDANEIKDTALGDAAAEGNPANISIAIVTTVTQID